MFLTERRIRYVFFLAMLLFGEAGDLVAQQSPSGEKNDQFVSAQLKRYQTGESVLTDSAWTVLSDASDYFQGISNSCGLGRVHAIKARLFNKNGRNDSATYHYLKSESLLGDKCDPFDLYYLYNSWALLNEQIEEFDKSIKLNDQARFWAEKIEDKTWLLNVLVNRANVLSKLNEHAKAIAQLKEVNRLAEESNLIFHQLISYQNIGAIFIRMQEYDSALVYLRLLQKQEDLKNFPFILMDMHNNMGVVYQELNQYQKAADEYFQALVLAKNNKALNPQLIYLSNYSNIKSLLGDYKDSREYLLQYIQLKDSLLNVEKFAILKNLESQYEYNKQREKIFELESAALSQDLEIERTKSARNIILFAFFGILMLLVGLYSRLSYSRRANRAIAEEKKRSEELLLNILPADVAEELKSTGSYKPKNFDEVTVLFADIKDFTTLSGHLTAAELVNELNEIFAAFDKIVLKYNLEKIKTIGDAYMVADGVQSDRAPSPGNVISAALEMMNFVESRREIKETDGKTWFAMRAGIHTGPVSSGIVGLIKFQYDIWGDTVNIASRMENCSEPGQVNISENTYSKVKHIESFLFQNRGEIEVKGKGKMSMYFVSIRN